MDIEELVNIRIQALAMVMDYMKTTGINLNEHQILDIAESFMKFIFKKRKFRLT